MVGYRSPKHIRIILDSAISVIRTHKDIRKIRQDADFDDVFFILKI